MCAEEKVCVWPKKSEIVCGFKCVCACVYDMAKGCASVCSFQYIGHVV